MTKQNRAAKPEMSAHSELNEALEALHRRSTSWAQAGPAEAISLLRALRARIFEQAETWIELGCSNKKLHKNHPARAEEWVSGPYVTMRLARLMQRTLEMVAKWNRVPLEKNVVEGEKNVRVRVFPTDLFDRFLFMGTRGEIWLEPEVKPEVLPQKTAVRWHEAGPPGTCLVLGAGNISSIPPMDVLTKVFIEKQVVCLKLNPVLDYLIPIYRKALAPLIDAKLLYLAEGDLEVSKVLTQHDRIDSIHITGSHRTFEAIRYGVGEEGQTRKKTGKPINNKPMTAELGNISPMIVVPGPWTEKQLEVQAERIATSLAYNAGFNCNATRILILPKEWNLKDRLMERLKYLLTGLPTREAYYPGAENLHKTFLKTYPNALQFCEKLQPGHLPWTLVEHLDPQKKDELFFHEEPFCALMGTVELSGPDAESFLAQAAQFANEKLWGSLNCSILIHPKTQKQLKQTGAWQKALSELKYGTIAINCWAATAYAFGSTTWGAYPGHTDSDIQSGCGPVHNAFMLEKVEKSVVEMPFVPFPKPVWFVTQQNAEPVVKALVRFEAKPSWLRFLRVSWLAMKNEWRKG
ncbi:MAG: aldehyde dehydrogenase [Acidobacteria bacterium]|nr:aldehyde dehydrogenase [Acidobacteriota bacterium]MCB9397358.1 aldehyde dehydrogenase [Acidobacteriota bacterium]